MTTKTELFKELAYTEMAIRADELLRHKQFVDFDRASSLNELSDKFLETYISIHKHLRKDSSQYPKVVGDLVYNMEQIGDEKLQVLKSSFNSFVRQIYGLKLKPHEVRERLPETIAKLFNDIDEIKLFGGKMALGTMLAILGQSEEFRRIAAPHGIDFSRVDPKNKDPYTQESFISLIKQALSPVPVKETQGFIPHPRAYETNSGLRFMCHKIDAKTHLLTENGYLVDYTVLGDDSLKARIERHIKMGESIRDFRVVVPSDAPHISDFIFPTDDMGFKEKAVILDIKAKAQALKDKKIMDREGLGEEMPLACMDVDRLTGLRRDEGNNELKRFKDFMGRWNWDYFQFLPPLESSFNLWGRLKEPIPMVIFQDAEVKEHIRGQISLHVEERMRTLKSFVRDDGDMLDILTRAEAQMKRMMPILWETAERQLYKTGEDSKLVKKQPGRPPQSYISQGGTATGKTGLLETAHHECGDDLVFASLDTSRESSDFLTLYRASDNHDDDYKSLEEFGTLARDLVEARAMALELNIFHDGTGIPYAGRTDAVVNKFKDKEYDVSLMAATAPLYNSDGRITSDAFWRLGSRFQDSHFIVPIEVVIDKHLGFPIAFMNAMQDEKIDRIFMQDYTGKQSEFYTLSYAIDGTLDQIRELEGKEGEALFCALKEEGLIPSWADMPPDKAGCVPDFKVVHKNGEKNKREQPTYRLQIITDLQQYIALQQKGLLNRHASGPEALNDHVLPFDIMGFFQKEEGKLRLMPPKHMVEMDPPGFSHAARIERSNQSFMSL